MKPFNLKLKSLLLDNIYGYETMHVIIDGVPYYKKPPRNDSLLKKLAWCIEIILGKAIAVHFKEDEE